MFAIYRSESLNDNEKTWLGKILNMMLTIRQQKSLRYKHENCSNATKKTT